ncbi:Transcriptional regulator, GntR family [Modestobacter italicus]|uniref:Transcriptional regulator, GntR family n=1 Tax=Modestobacter italicus (strain DSM 44449 / CECT 9708 / BC 501) TaxID=2732864 RepID=I4F1E3_MODI5|nr:GntR family transcriptional regulator [Modestobacter marinus]CCH89456.1 Transcriptional regulator, GntR family [Modestobacter marinus]
MTRSLTSAERALDTLREDILRGALPAGARLGEVELAERLGVSRTPVREALSRLAAEGLVELVPNRGARVASWTVDELEGVFALRSLLEPQLTALAVPHATAADLDALDDLAARMVDLGDRDPDALVPLNRAFHGRLVELAAAPALATALAGAVHSPLVARNFHAYDAASLQRSLAHHTEIVAALRAGDPEWARAVMTAHIHNARAVMVRAAARPR